MTRATDVAGDDITVEAPVVMIAPRADDDRDR
jgi:hypothetical protein